MRTLILVLPLLLWPLALVAAPDRYTLDADDSTVAFEYTLNNSALRGTMPVAEANLVLDFNRAANSRIDVAIDARRARTGLVFATEALRGPEILDTRRFPTITFVSTRLRAEGDRAVLDGEVTIRGVTRPITLEAEIFRPEGSAPGDRDRLTVRLTGAVSRAAFGADGFASFVGDQVGLQIVARIRRIE